MIRGLMFDLYDTLIYIEQDIFDHYRSKFCGLIGVTGEEVARIWAKYLPQRFDGTIVTLKDMIEIVLKEINIDKNLVDIKHLEELEIKALTRSVETYQGVEGMLENFNKNGLKMAIVSNASYVSKFVIQQLPWIKYFEHVIISCDIKMAKPDRAIYQYTLEQMGMKPDECLFIGDGGSMELDGAMGMGIKSVKVIQDKQSPLYKRSEKYDFLIDSITEVPKVLDILRQHC
jgi:putative hydrolase of the HAD superfamily